MDCRVARDRRNLRLACAARKKDNWFPVYLYIELNTYIDVKLYPASTKNLYNIYTASAQRLRRWSNIVCFVFAGYVLPSCWVYWTWCVYVYGLCPHMCPDQSHIFTGEAYFMCMNVLFLLWYLNTFDIEAERTNIIYSFIEYICYDLKDIDVNH